MICPRCHNENKYDNLTCDFCMATLPMSEKRKAEIDKKIRKAKREYISEIYKRKAKEGKK
jgi:hypothetical protein